jgi:hypothetical protein
MYCTNCDSTKTLRKAQVRNPDKAWKRRTDWQVSIVDINSSLSHLLHHCRLRINVCPQWSYLHTPVIHLSCHCCLPDAGGSKKIHMISHKQGTQDVLQNIRWLVKQSGDWTCQQRTLCTRRPVSIACTKTHQEPACGSIAKAVECLIQWKNGEGQLRDHTFLNNPHALHKVRHDSSTPHIPVTAATIASAMRVPV